MDSGVLNKILRQVDHTVTKGTVVSDVLKISVKPTAGGMHSVTFSRSFGEDDRFNSFSFHLSTEDMLNFEQAISDYNISLGLQ